MKKIVKIYDRLTEVYAKRKVLPVVLTIQCLVFSLIVLIFANVIISKGRISGELDFQQIKLYYNIAIVLLFVFSAIYPAYFLSNGLNSLVKNNTIEYLTSAKISVSEISFAVFLKGFFSSVVATFSLIPIACVSFYFGGVGLERFISIIICLLLFDLLLSTISLFMSANIIDENMSRIFSHSISFMMLIFQIVILDSVINDFLVLACYSIVVIIISLVLLAYTKKGRVFIF